MLVTRCRVNVKQWLFDVKILSYIFPSSGFEVGIYLLKIFYLPIFCDIYIRDWYNLTNYRISMRYLFDPPIH